MSYLDLVDQISLFRSLFAIDESLASRAQSCGCAHCGGPLHVASYGRKPRGELVDVPAEYRVRLSLCCGHCRRRRLPDSVLYFGRRVYWGCIVVLVTGARQGPNRMTFTSLTARFGVSRRTVKRWLSFFTHVFPDSDAWLQARGRVSPLVSSGGLPGQLLSWFVEHQGATAAAIVGCLRFLCSPTTEN